MNEVKKGLDDTATSLEILGATFTYVSEVGKDPKMKEHADTVEEVIETVRQVEDKLESSKDWKVFNHNTDMDVIKTFVVEMEFMR